MMLAASCLRPMLMDAFVVRIANCAPCRQLVRERVDPRVKLCRRHRMVDQTHARGIGSGHQIAGHQPFLGPRVADELRPDDRGAITGRKSDADVRITDLRSLSGEDDIAEDGECRAEACRMAVDPGDDRLFGNRAGER